MRKPHLQYQGDSHYYLLTPPGATRCTGSEDLLDRASCFPSASEHWTYFIDADLQAEKESSSLYGNSQVSNLCHQGTYRNKNLSFPQYSWGFRLMPGSRRRLCFLLVIPGVMYSADLLLHLFYLATEMLNQAYVSCRQGQNFLCQSLSKRHHMLPSVQALKSCTLLWKIGLSWGLWHFRAVAPAGARKYALCQHARTAWNFKTAHLLKF